MSSISADKIHQRAPLLRSVEGEQLLELAKAVEVGGTLTYAAVRSALGVDLQSAAGRNLWRAVQKHLADEHARQFRNIPGEGYQRLDDDGKVDKSGKLIAQATGRARAAGRVLATTDRSKLSAPKQLAYDVQGACLAVMQTAAKPAIAATKAQPPSPDEISKIAASLKALAPRSQ